MGLLEGLAAASVLSGLCLLVLRARPWAARAERATALAIAILALGLLWPGLHDSAGWRFTLFPGAGDAGLAARPPGIYLAVIAFAALGLAHLLPAGVRAPGAGWPGLGHLLCGLAAAGVTVDHMLMLFLLAAAAALPTLALLLADGNRGLPLWRNILLLRVAGDVFLLLILALYALVDAWTIDAMIALAQASPAAQLWPALLCGLLAVWVKLGLPPADGWLRDALRARPVTYILTAGVGLPLLGGYLLYRLRPVALAAGAGPLLLGLAALALGWALLRRQAALGGRLLDSTGALIVGLAATSLPGWYLPLLVLARVAILVAPALPLGLSYRLAEAEQPAFQRGLGKLARQLGEALAWLAAALQRQHTGLLGRSLLWACLGIALLLLLSVALGPVT